MRISERINALIHPLMMNYVCRKYNRKMRWCEKRHPELFKPIDREITKKHVELWGRLGLPCSDKWLRFLSNISGIADYRYAPEDLVFSCVERILNDCERGGHEAEDKNQFDLYVDLNDQPRTFLRYIRGSFYDEEHCFVSESMAKSILQRNNGDLIGKVCVNSLGGHGISAFSFQNGGYMSSQGDFLTTDWIKSVSHSYILQEKVEQCNFSKKFNPSSANSCKLVTLRCPWNGEIKVVKAGMRFGVTSDVFDNLSSGGISVAVSTEGELGKTAYNWYKADPFPEHPSSHIPFRGQVHPYFGKMKELACKYARRVHNMNMLSWDMIADKGGNIKILEVNATSQSHDWLQFDFGALFGDYTEDVVAWCAAHKEFDKFNHFRTWY